MQTCVHDNYLREQKLVIHRSRLPALNWYKNVLFILHLFFIFLWKLILILRLGKGYI